MAEKKCSVRVPEVDYKELLKIKEETRIPLAQLIHIAVPMLNRKYGMGEKSND